MGNKVFKKINENKLTLDTNLCELSSDEAIDVITDILTRFKVPFTIRKNFHSQLNNDIDLIDTTHFYIENDYDRIRLGLDNYGSYIKLKMMYKGDRIKGGLSKNIKVETPKDMIDVISHFIPEFTNDRVFKKINEDKSDINNILSADLTEKDFNETVGILENFLTKVGLYYEIEEHLTGDKSFIIGEEGNLFEQRKVNITILVENFHNGKTELIIYYRNERKPIDNLLDVIQFISEHRPELVNNKIFKKINEGWFDRKKKEEKVRKLDISTKFNDMHYHEIIKHISKFLEKSNIEYEWGVYPTGTNYFVIKGDGNNKQLEIKARRDGDGFKVFAEYIGDVDSGIDTDWGEQIVYNLIDLSMFISKHMPELTNDRVFKKINESNEESEKDVIRKFIKYVTNLDEWEGTNEGMFDAEDEYESYEEFRDENVYECVLFENMGEGMDVINYETGDIITIDSSIKYFFVEYYSDPNMNQSTYYVYQNGEFRKSTYSEGDYLRSLDDQIGLGNQDNIIAIGYDDWKKNKESTLNAVRNINETKICTSFNKFKLIYKV